MKLKEYLIKNNLSIPNIRKKFKIEFGKTPSFSTLASIRAQESEPKLELAIMIVGLTKGAVDYSDLVIKRRYNLSKTIYETEEIGRRLADPTDEVHDVSDEDLEAAADFLDELIDNELNDL